MAIFKRRQEVQATCSPTVVSGNLGAIANGVGTGRDRAMRLPTVARSRDINASLIGSLPIRRYGTQWNGEQLEEIALPPEPWQLRPDPESTRTHMLSWLYDDMRFYGFGAWYVTRRYAATGFPAEFKWLPAACVQIVSPATYGNYPVGGVTDIQYNGVSLPKDDVILFFSSLDPFLETGARAVRISERLDTAAERFACTEVPAGYLRITGGEPMSSEDLQLMADAWSEARQANTTAILSENLDYVPTDVDASKMQLTEGRNYADLALSRCMDTPPYLVGAPTGTGMTYQNAVQARGDAIIFGALPYIEVIEQVLSSDRVTPRGQIIRLDRSAWLDNPLDNNAETPAEQLPQKANV